jgi:hypothetical protein
MTTDPMRSVVDYDRDEARSAARDAADPWVEMTRAEAERDDFFDWLDEVAYQASIDETRHLGRRPLKEAA